MIQFQLERVWPNPSPREVDLRFGIPEPGTLDVTIHDVAGRLVQRIVAGSRVEPGVHLVQWNGLLQENRAAACGVYFLLARFQGESGKRGTARGRCVLLQ